MMEVKQNTPMDFNDLMSSNSEMNARSDGIMADLEPSELKSGLLNTNELARNGLLSGVTNGSSNFNNEAGPIDLDIDSDLGEPVSPELEEELLAEEGANVVDKLLAEAVPKAANILDNKPDVLSTIESLDTMRNPADDFDRLLSKINEFENCSEIARHATKQSNCNNEESRIVETGQTSTKSTNNGDKVEDIAIEAVETENKTAETTKTVDTNAMSEPAVLNDNVVQDRKDEAAQKDIADKVETEQVISVIAITKEADAAKQETDVSKEIVDSAEVNKNVDEITEAGQKKSDISVLSVDDDDDEKIMKAVNAKEIETKFKKSTAPTADAGKDVTAAKQDADDSDDDIIFFEDKPADSKHKEPNTEEKTQESGKDAVTEAHKKPTDIVEDDDVVLLDDDDDEVTEKSTNDQVESTEVKKCTKSAVEEHKEEIKINASTEANKENKDTVVPKAATTKAEDADKAEVQDKVKVEISPKVEKTKTNSTAKPEIEVEENKQKVGLSSDNSDNARDDFVADKGIEVEKETAKSKSDLAEETNSNCSSSSNLLQETQAASDVGDGEEAEAEAELEEEDEVEADVDDIEGDADGDGDLELGEDVIPVGEETKDSVCAPPTKRIRLSADGEEGLKPIETEESRSNSKSDDMVQTENSQINEISLNADEQLVTDKEVTNATASVKRSYDALDQTDTEKNEEKTEEVTIKKAKLEESDVKQPTKEEDTAREEISDGGEDVKELKSDALQPGEEKCEKSEDVKEKPTEEYRLPEIKAVPSDIPVPLYPPPKFEDSVPTLSLDFLKRFRKTFDNMTKNDLEELVLQKVVETIVHKSEFAELREIIEKQEKIIVSHRNKICELTKQFRDLEMVHNRVVKDIETRNSQFLMPVKITRAVGLQVYIPNKRSNEPLVNTPTTLATQSQSTSSVPQAQPRSTPVPSTSTSPRAQGSGDLRSNNSALASAAAAAAVNSRRGCVQKVTPQRPVDGGINSNNNAMLKTTQVSPGVYRSGNVLLSALTPGAQAPQQNALRVLNKGVAMQRNRYSSPTPTELQRQQQLQQQQLARQQAQNANQRKLMSKTSPTSAHMITQQQQYRRAEGSNAGVDIPLTPQVPAGVSITPAKPKEKAVIDLTDEDEQQASGATQVRRLSAQAASNVNVSTQYLNNRTVPPLTRMPTATQMSNKTQTAARQQLANIQANSKANANSMLSHISTPPGTSITRVHIAPSNLVGQRTKYGHPAPLPITPPQTYNPAWKLPPPRPTIRISNLDNGIVISWTMEESMDRHAECVSYQIYAYQETSAPPMVDSWRHVGDVKAMLLPMAVTLTQFQEGQRYYFAVRAVDVHQRFGPFSLPKTWT